MRRKNSTHADEVRHSLAVKRGIAALREILKQLRWDDQGGYPSYAGNGRWLFATTSLPQTTPEQLNALFAMVGIVPDKIESLGSCQECAHSIGGHERGYVRPCLDCKRPKMSNFVKGEGEPR